MTWNSKILFRCASAAGAMLLVLLATQAISAQSRDGAAGFVERLDKLEKSVGERQRHTAELREELEAMTRALRREATSLETANRARLRVKRKVAEQLVAWERADRELRRAARYLPPGDAADTQVLLARAEPEALRGRMDDIGVLQTIETDVRRTRDRVADRAGLVVQIAQSAGDTEAAEATREKVVEEARRPQNQKQVDEELERADEALENSLGMLLKNETQRDFHRLKGTLLPPVANGPTFGYGPRKQKGSMSYVRHTGLTWKIRSNTPVKTVASGVVVFAGRFEGFGKMIIVDHGQDYHSLYAHLGSLDVEVGKSIGRGTVLGKSGESGSFEGPKLYFELRKDGKPFDPSPWFIQR
ncbi:murein hydrolase activator EnvC family protein [Persicimonas caeni]|nr:M23 family metallopeptidase [Persicimonas caeni]